MSVLMRGADMPKNCEECNFKGECRQYWEKIREAYTRPSWCPLVEVADTPQTEKNCDNCGTKTEACYFCDTGRNMWTPQTEMEKSGSRAVQTARCLNCHNAKACKENNWEVCKYEPWKLTVVEDEPQTDCSWQKGE